MITRHVPRPSNPRAEIKTIAIREDFIATIPGTHQKNYKSPAVSDSAAITGLAIFAIAFASYVFLAMRWQSKQEKRRKKEDIDEIILYRFKEVYGEYPLLPEMTDEQKNENQDVASEASRLIAAQWKRSNIEKISRHRYVIYDQYILSKKRPDAYGIEAKNAWLNQESYEGISLITFKNNAFEKNNFGRMKDGFPYFWKNVLVDKGDYKAWLWSEGWKRYHEVNLLNSPDVNLRWHQVIHDWIEKYAIEEVQSELKQDQEDQDEINETTKAEKEYPKKPFYTNDNNWMLEKLTSGLSKKGWTAIRIRHRDIDIIATKNDKEILITCRDNERPVTSRLLVNGNLKLFTKSEKLNFFIISTSGFTKRSQEFAHDHDIILLVDIDRIWSYL